MSKPKTIREVLEVNHLVVTDSLADKFLKELEELVAEAMGAVIGGWIKTPSKSLPGDEKYECVIAQRELQSHQRKAADKVIKEMFGD